MDKDIVVLNPDYHSKMIMTELSCTQKKSIL